MKKVISIIDIQNDKQALLFLVCISLIHCKKKKRLLLYIFKFNQLGCLSHFNLNYVKLKKKS